jgi:uncharacterized RDD family membrane protein YckC
MQANLEGRRTTQLWQDTDTGTSILGADDSCQGIPVLFPDSPTSFEWNVGDAQETPGAADRNRDALPLAVAGASIRRDIGALSTFTGQAELSPLWKREVSQRVAAHRKRKGSTASDAESPAHIKPHSNSGGSSRLSEAAARVAARYAAAPSYSDLLAADIRSASIEPEPAAEQIMLLDLAPTSAETSSREVLQVSTPVEQPRISSVEAPVAVEASRVAEPVLVSIPDWERDWERDWGFDNNLRVSSQHPLSEALKRESHRAGGAVDEPAAGMPIAPAQAIADPWRETNQAIWSEAADGSYAAEHDGCCVDPHPIHGNLIEFPNEVVAARKVRPRRAEGIYASAMATEPQLSIFEVDPASVSTQPDVAEQSAQPPAWSKPEWADMKLGATQAQKPAAEPVVEALASKAPELQAAPMNLRVLAAVVDFALVSMAFLIVAILVAMNATVMPNLREAEIGGGLVFAAIAFAYLAISYTLARATPGMRYALLSLRTFDGQTPTREQRCRRLGALAVSMLPVGLGAVWALFDEQHLAWHDRWSGTYLRRV